MVNCVAAMSVSIASTLRHSAVDYCFFKLDLPAAIRRCGWPHYSE